MSYLLLWGGSLSASALPDDTFDPQNPEEPSAVDVCRIKVSADPAEGAYVSGGGRYIVNGSPVYISTNACNTEDYTYTFKYWTQNGEITSYSQYFYFYPTKGDVEFVAHYEKAEVVFDPSNPAEPSSSNIKRKYYLYLISSIEGACSFNVNSGDKIEEGRQFYIYPNYNSNYYHFEGWKVNGQIISIDSYLYYTMPSANTTLEACFSEIPYDPENPVEPSSQGGNVDNSTRRIMDFSIGNSSGFVDKTRIVLNEKRSVDYESDCDASKFTSNTANFQIYSIGSNVKYSINERPLDSGEIPLGIIVKNAGSVTIGATRLECSATLVDKLLNKEQDLALGNYTFDSEAGTFDDRFIIRIAVTDALTITAKSYTRAYGEANPTFEYTSTGAALEGYPSITCEATPTSDVGTYDIVVSKGSVSNTYVTYVNGTLSITKATIKASVGEYTITEGDDIPTFTIGYDGFKNNETAEVFTVVPVAACSATKESKAGEYEITISGGEATNYEFSYTAGKLVILEPLMTITAKNYSRTYGEDNPAFEYTTTGGTLNGTPEISCEATKASNVGTYTITLSKGNVTNGNVTLVNGTLTITQAPLKASVGEYTITEGDDIPSFTISYDGFKNNETADVLTTKPMAKCDATKESKAGEYEITISGGEATNYSFSYTSGKLIIEAAPSPEPEGTTFDENVGDSSSDENQVTFIVRNSDNGDTPTVAIFDDKDVTGEFDIPETVIYNNVNYIVKEIAAGAFQNNIGLTAVSIPESIASIGEKAFAGCTSLQSITVYITKPINLSAANARRLTRTDGSSVFEGVDKETCILYVPEGSVDLYKAAPVWKEFKNILAIGTSTGVKTILNADGKPFDIYDLNGRIVKAKTTSTYGLPKGVYIIDRKKVVVD